MSGLRPDMLDILGFQDALKLYVKNFENRYKIECIFKCDETLIQLRPEYTVALYRIFQESLSNVVRHSKATLVEIRIVCIDSKLRFLIADNGIGFDPVIQNRVGSYGLLSIKERVFLMDGNLVIDSASGKGTKVEIEIPYNQTI